jgi:uncharacterized protein YbbK (DUF523 family)
MLYRKFTNLPLELIGSLHQALRDDLKWASENSDSDLEDQNFYSRMSHIVLICPATAEGFQVERSAIDVTGSSSVMFDYFEDEIYHQRSTKSFLFRSNMTKGLMAGLVVPTNALQRCVDDIHALLAKSK